MAFQYYRCLHINPLKLKLFSLQDPTKFLATHLLNNILNVNKNAIIIYLGSLDVYLILFEAPLVRCITVCGG